MGTSDHKQISKEIHELNYLLRKNNKRQTLDNRKKLKNIIDSFKKGKTKKSEKSRSTFEDYLEKFNRLDRLDDIE